MKYRSHQITQNQVRLLLFKECDWRGRKLLFDSSTIEKTPAGKNDKPNIKKTENGPCIVEVSDGFSYMYKGPAADANVLGEMMFGAVAMSSKGVSLRVHLMEDPKRMMYAKVFSVPASRRISRADPKADASDGSNSKPLNVPTLKEEGVSLSFSVGRGDSGFYGEHSPQSSVGSTYDYCSMFEDWDGNNNSEDYVFHSPVSRKLSTSSNGSWQRRTFQNLSTRFEFGSSNLLRVPTASSNGNSSDSQIYSNSSTSGTTGSLTSAVYNPQKRTKLGLALLITVADKTDVSVACLQHTTQLQALLCRLRLWALAAGAGAFVATLHDAAQHAATYLSDLLYGPRVPALWLSVVGEPRTAPKISERLLTDLCSVLAMGDTKDTNFFISTLLTHVLTYHLGWVTTVSPYDVVDPEVTEKSYNALWAQLGDLSGSIGLPPRSTRTVVAGANQHFLNKLLLVLTYFMRCGEVRRTEFAFQQSRIEPKVIQVADTARRKADANLAKPAINTQNSHTSVSTLVAEPMKRSVTLASINQKLSTVDEKPMTSQLRRNPTTMLPLNTSNSSLSDLSETEVGAEQNVVFVLGEDEKLVGLKNKSSGGKRVKKTSKVLEPPNPESTGPAEDRCSRDGSPKCCGQTLQHSKPIKHSGFKFEFDKYPQIVTNYMKSKNLEILDRHYIGKPGNLKLDNFQFDPTVVPPIQEERTETCFTCRQMESLLQTPTNASEMEYMNDIPRQSEPHYAKETIVTDRDTHREVSPKVFVKKREVNTVVVNVDPVVNQRKEDNLKEVKQIVEFPLPVMTATACGVTGFDKSLFGGITDHYVPDLILQGTLAAPSAWERELWRDLEVTTYLNKSADVPVQAVAIVADTNTWEVRLVGRECGTGGMSSLVGNMLDALPSMWRARVPAHQCLSFLEAKLREFCVLSKTLADMLMTTDFCDIATLTKSLNIDVNDVPLLLAVATTHTPQVANRYGISYT